MRVRWSFDPGRQRSIDLTMIWRRNVVALVQIWSFYAERGWGGGGERKREKGKRRVGQRGKGKGKGKVAPPSMCVICVREKKRCDEREKCVWAWRRKMLYEKRLSFLKKKKRISSLFVTNHRMSVCYKIYCYVTVC